MPKSTHVRMLTDTTAVLPVGYIQAHALEVLPQVIIFGHESNLEEYEISYSEFIRRLKDSIDLPKTAAPPIGEAVSALKRLMSEAETVICIHPSTELSGTVRTVETATAEAFPDADIRILDTRVVGGNLASMVIKATEWAENGVEADEIMHRLHDLIPRARTYFMVDTLEFLHRGGRIGGAASLLGSALRIKPTLQLTEGRIDVLEKIRTHRRAVERLIELVIADTPEADDSLLCVMQAEALDHAQRLAETFRQMFGVEEIPIYPLGAAITTHVGPGTLGVGFFT